MRWDEIVIFRDTDEYNLYLPVSVCVLFKIWDNFRKSFR